MAEDINARRKRLLAEAMAAGPAGWTTARVQALYRAAGDDVDINTCWGWLRALTVVEPAEPDALFGLEAVTR
jgi:hypothetical protein